MAVYKAKSFNLSPRHQRRHQLALSLLVIVEILALVGVAYVIYRRDTQVATPIEGSAVSGGYFDPNPKVTTDDFSFRAPNNWSQDKLESKPGMYIFKAYNGSLVTQVLYIYVNRPLEETRVTYLQPVTVDGNKMILGKMSKHCDTITKKDGVITYEGASFNCWAQNGQAFLGVGLVDGGSSIPLTTESGVVKNYSFRLIDSRFSPSFNDITNILKSFRAN